MKRKVVTFVLLVPFLLLGSVNVFAQTSSLSFFPAQVVQGEPLMIQVNNNSPVQKITFDGRKLDVFIYGGKPTAFYGIDLRKKTGTYDVITEFSNGSTIKSTITVGERKKIEAPLGIPEKLGGNTTQSQNNLVSTLAEENKTLESIYTGKKAFWTLKFAQPLEKITITDEFGYSRKTGSYSIAHKGVDYRASEGTKVMSINRGVVRLTRNYRNYGKVIVVDHGLGLMSFYLHLSKIKVNEGELVQRGQVIGLSGQTGYATAPHLHLSIRINGISVDPVKFFNLFQ